MKKEYSFKINDHFNSFFNEAEKAVLAEKNFTQIMKHSAVDAPSVYQYKNEPSGQLISIAIEDLPGELKKVYLESETVDLAAMVVDIFVRAYQIIGKKLVEPVESETLAKKIKDRLGL